MLSLPPRARLSGALGASLLAALLIASARDAHFTAAREPEAAPKPADYAAAAKPLVQKYCLSCHSAKAKKGSLDLERFATEADLRAILDLARKSASNLLILQGSPRSIRTDHMRDRSRARPAACERSSSTHTPRPS